MARKIEVDLDTWLEMHRRWGYARGLLRGWLDSSGGSERWKAVTRDFLEKSDVMEL